MNKWFVPLLLALSVLFVESGSFAGGDTANVFITVSNTTTKKIGLSVSGNDNCTPGSWGEVAVVAGGQATLQASCTPGYFWIGWNLNTQNEARKIYLYHERTIPLTPSLACGNNGTVYAEQGSNFAQKLNQCTSTYTSTDKWFKADITVAPK